MSPTMVPGGDEFNTARLVKTCWKFRFSKEKKWNPKKEKIMLRRGGKRHCKDTREKNKRTAS